jgi:hypothetical protein
MENESEKFTRTGLLTSIREERRLLESTLVSLSEPQMLIAGVEGQWSIKDILAHISAWERRMISWTGILEAGGKPIVPLPWDVDCMNAESAAQDKDKPLAVVKEEFQQSYLDSLKLVESLDEARLRIKHEDTWPMDFLWIGIASNMNWHYKEHREHIENWLAAGKQDK